MIKLLRNRAFLTSAVASIFLVLVSVVYFFNQGYFIGRNSFAKNDEPDYLEGALLIRDYGGPAKFISYLVSGTYAEARKHPLYMFMLSFFAKPDLSFFVEAKFFNFVLGGVLLVTSFFVMKGMFNTLAAVYFSLILSLNEFILTETSFVVPDNLMILLILLSAFFYYSGFKEESRKQLKYWVLGSVFCGLAYLTKPNGIFILGAFGLSSLVLYRKSILHLKNFYVALATFLLLVSPLLVRNVVLYRNPFYNNNATLLWIDNRQERRAPNFLENPPTFIEYFSHQSAVLELETFAVDSVKILSNFSMLVLFGEWRWRYSFLLILAALLAIALDKDKKRSIFLGIFFVFSYLFFSYNFKVSPHYRHVMPIIFIPVGFISLSVRRGLGRIRNGGSLLYMCLVVSIALAGLALGFSKMYSEDRLNMHVFEGQVDLPAPYTITRQWLLDNVKPQDKFVIGLDDNYMFFWYTKTRGERIVQPYFLSMDDFQSYVKSGKVNYVVLGSQTVNSFPEIYGDYFQKMPGSGDYIKFIKTPLDWSLVLKYPYENNNNFRTLIYNVEGVWKK